MEPAFPTVIATVCSEDKNWRGDLKVACYLRNIQIVINIPEEHEILSTAL